MAGAKRRAPYADVLRDPVLHLRRQCAVVLGHEAPARLVVPCGIVELVGEGTRGHRRRSLVHRPSDRPARPAVRIGLRPFHWRVALGEELDDRFVRIGDQGRQVARALDVRRFARSGHDRTASRMPTSTTTSSRGLVNGFCIAVTANQLEPPTNALWRRTVSRMTGGIAAADIATSAGPCAAISAPCLRTVRQTTAVSIAEQGPPRTGGSNASTP